MSLQRILTADIRPNFLQISYVALIINADSKSTHLQLINHVIILTYVISCIITGFVYQSCLLFMTVTWFLHVFHLFLVITFPIWSLQFFSHSKGTRKLILCILEILGSVIFCSILPTIVLSVSHYRIATFPPLITIPTRELSLYTFILPVTLLLAVGVNLIFLSFWKIHKVCVHSYYCASL